MRNLNWRAKHIDLKHENPNQPVSKLMLRASDVELLELSTELAATFSAPGEELRLSLPQGWTVFWKCKETQSRLFLAHPAADEWVASLTMGAAAGNALAGVVAGMARTRVPIHVSSQLQAIGTALSPFNNFDLGLEVS